MGFFKCRQENGEFLKLKCLLTVLITEILCFSKNYHLESKEDTLIDLSEGERYRFLKANLMFDFNQMLV